MASSAEDENFNGIVYEMIKRFVNENVGEYTRKIVVDFTKAINGMAANGKMETWGDSVSSPYVLIGIWVVQAVICCVLLILLKTAMWYHPSAKVPTVRRMGWMEYWITPGRPGDRQRTMRMFKTRPNGSNPMRTPSATTDPIFIRFENAKKKFEGGSSKTHKPQETPSEAASSSKKGPTKVVKKPKRV